MNQIFFSEKEELYFKTDAVNILNLLHKCTLPAKLYHNQSSVDLFLVKRQFLYGVSHCFVKIYEIKKSMRRANKSDWIM